MNNPDAFERILASLYDAMLDETRWPATSALIDEACGLTGNGLMVAEGPPDDVRALFVGLYSRGQRREDLEREYLENYHAIDERVPRFRQLPVRRLVHITDLYTAEELKTSPTYNDLLPHIQQFVRVRQALVRAGARSTTVTALLDNPRGSASSNWTGAGMEGRMISSVLVLVSLGFFTLDAAAQGSTTYYFPQLAVGASWQTTITYINYSSEEVICTTEFLSDHGSPLMVSFAGLGTVDSRTDVLPPGGSVHQETDVDLSAPLAPGWAQATCSGPVKASLLYRLRNSEGAPTAEVGVNAAAVPATRFVTFAEQGEGQFGTGVAYANPSATSAHVTFTARDTAGEVLASVDRTLLPGGHDAHGMAELFGLTSFTGSIEVTSTEPIVSLSINLEAAPVFSSLPPGDIVDTPRPPLTWVFAGDVPDIEQTMLREELEYSRAYFADKFGVTARGFTILVGENYEALSPVYRDVVGYDLSHAYHPEAKYAHAWVTSSAQGSAVMTLMYGLETGSFSSLKHSIVHEYFHVLQGQLASGFTQLQNGEFGSFTSSLSVAPFWLVEGHASYADYKYSATRSGRRLFYDRFTPFEDLAWFQTSGLLNYGDLARTVSCPGASCAFGGVYLYALSFAASLFLAEQAGEDSYVEFWRLRGERSTWEQAFEKAFGTGVNDFYKAFEEWLPSQIPSRDQVTIQILWPDMEANPQIRGEFLYLDPAISWEANSNPRGRYSTGSKGFGGDDLYLTITYPAGAIGRGTLSLWWSDDQITVHLLGWYKDGELTDQHAEATPIKFTGVSYSIEWTLPAHPNTLPRLRTEDF